jgi:hypothetical protein
MPGLLSNILSLINPLPLLKENYIDSFSGEQLSAAFTNVKNNYFINPINGALADANGTARPTTDTSVIRIGSLLGNNQSFLATKKIIINAMNDAYIDDDEDPSTPNTPVSYEIPAGSIITRYSGPFTRNNSQIGGLLNFAEVVNGPINNTRPADPYSTRQGRDINGDGMFGDKLFVGTDGNTYVALAPNNYTYEQYRNASAASLAAGDNFPDVLNRSDNGSYLFPTSGTTAVRIQKNYRTFDNMNSNGIHPLLGAGYYTGLNPLNSGYIYGQPQQSILGMQSQYNPNNPHQHYYDTVNVDRSYETKPKVTFVTVADQSEVNSSTTLQDLKKYLLQGYTFQGSILSNAGPWPNVPYNIKDADGNITSTVNITDAYVNRKGELVVEYA